MRNMNRKRSNLKYILIAVVILIVLTVSILVVNGVRGEGITYASLSATYQTQKAFQNIKKGNYEKATSYIGFLGYSEDKTTIESKNIESEKSRVIQGLSDYFELGNRELISYSDVRFLTDDGFTKGSIELEIKEGLEVYFFTLTIAKQSGKIYPMAISEIEIQDGDQESAEKAAEELMSIIGTYYPG